MTTQENIKIAESFGIRQSMFHRVEDYQDVANNIAYALKSKDDFAIAFAKFAEDEMWKEDTGGSNLMPFDQLLEKFKSTQR